MNTLESHSARLMRVALLLVLGIALFDFCFWGQTEFFPGLSVPAFFLGCTILIILARSGEKLSGRARLILLLLGGCLVEGVLDPASYTGVYSFLLLLFALAGELQFSTFARPAERWLAQFRALLRGPFRVVRLPLLLIRTWFPSGHTAGQVITNRIVWTIPVIAIAMVFGGLLDSGNAVFSHWTGAFFDWLGQLFWRLLDLERVFCWLGAAIILLPLLWPSLPPDGWRSRLLQLPRFSDQGAQTGLWPSLFALIVFNLIFLCGNAADLVFLWGGEALPPGVNYAQFVHEGTISLIVAVVLSALVLTLIFQQAPAVAGRKDLKLLAYVWIAQNLFLLASVALRLKRYIEAYDMTVTRLSLLIFLLLVAAGYALLAVKIQKEKSLSWLLGGATLAVSFTFYLTQFLNLGGWTARYNVRQWEQNPTRNLDVPYLGNLGPAAWPALYEACTRDRNIARQFEDRFSIGEENPDLAPSLQHWRSWSFRAWQNRWPQLPSTLPPP